jgi:hypothetical protein
MNKGGGGIVNTRSFNVSMLANLSRPENKTSGEDGLVQDVFESC